MKSSYRTNLNKDDIQHCQNLIWLIPRSHRLGKPSYFQGINDYLKMMNNKTKMIIRTKMICKHNILSSFQKTIMLSILILNISMNQIDLVMLTQRLNHPPREIEQVESKKIMITNLILIQNNRHSETVKSSMTKHMIYLVTVTLSMQMMAQMMTTQKGIQISC